MIQDMINSETSINYLNGKCPDRVVSRMCALEWPPRSPILAIWYFVFRGYIKNRIWNAPQPQQSIVIQ